MLNLRHTLRSASVALLTAALLGISFNAAAEQFQAIKQGQKFVMATHSFNVFIGTIRSRDQEAADIPTPMAQIAAERGKAGHEAVAIQMIGGSTPMQHWQQGGDDSKNIAKVALREGGVDVFTMSPNAVMPEPAIDLFGDLVIETNPDARIMVQNSWSAWDGNGSTVRNGDGERPERPSFTNEDHNKADIATIDRWLASLEAKGGYMERMRAQLEGINKRAGKSMTYVVPSAVAVYNLRKEIIKGNVPGIEKQSDIFRDGLGHLTTPGIHLVTYVWYAAMYRESPLGLQSLIDPNDSTSAVREAQLQKIAWDAVLQEPMSGVKM
jgi:hypothetical protein